MVRLQYISDLHLEHYKIYKEGQLHPLQWLKPDPTADALVLAGDIGWPNKPAYGLFMQWCSDNWKQVFVVAGNHEFYNEFGGEKYTYEAKLEMLDKIARSLPNVQFLQQRRVELQPGVWILGCTLWSEIPEDMRKEVSLGLNDFRFILETTVDRYNAWHASDRAWLEKELAEIRERGEKAIVVTHHLPTSDLISEIYWDHPLNCCYASDLEEVIAVGAPLAWICGHSHTGKRVRMGVTELALNPYGYPGERVGSRAPQAVLELDLGLGVPQAGPLEAQKPPATPEGVFDPTHSLQQ